jgi:4-carboxymuconolactone decarboxylase
VSEDRRTTVAIRVPGLSLTECGDEVRQILEATVGPISTLEGRSGRDAEPRPLNILTVIAHQPQLLGPFLGWASALALHGVVPRRDHELLALRTAANCRSDFEWGHHVVYGRAAGFDDTDLARIVTGPDTPGWDTHDEQLLRTADELHRDATISDTTWAYLAANYLPGALVEIPLIVGQYMMLSMLANAAGVELEAGLERLPGPRPRA